MDEVRYISILRLLRLLIVTGVCLVLFGVESAWSGDPFSFSGNWSYRKNSDEVEDSSQFNHGYSLGYSKDLSQMLSLAGSVRYSETKPSTGDGSSSINPSLSLDLKNDLFAFNLGASENQQGQSGGTTSTNTSWGVTAYSQVEDWPGVRLSFSSSALADDQSPSSQDSQSTSMGGSIDYEIFDVSMLYDFRSSISDDNISQSTSENTDHMAQVKYSRSFFDNLVSILSMSRINRSRILLLGITIASDCTNSSFINSAKNGTTFLALSLASRAISFSSLYFVFPSGRSIPVNPIITCFLLR